MLKIIDFLLIVFDFIISFIKFLLLIDFHLFYLNFFRQQFLTNCLQKRIFL